MVSEMALITISVLPLLMLWMLEPTELPVRDGQELRVGRWLLLPPIRARFRLTLGLCKSSEDEDDMESSVAANVMVVPMAAVPLLAFTDGLLPMIRSWPSQALLMSEARLLPSHAGAYSCLTITMFDV